MEEVLVPIVACLVIFIGLPWIIFHYVTRWKTAATLTGDDERLLEDLYALGRRLDDRVATIERIMDAENPGWRQLTADPADLGIESRIQDRRNVQ